MQVPPPTDPEVTVSPAYVFFSCLVLVFLAVELLIWILPKGLQRKVNQLRFGPFKEKTK
jgi:uncharacterized membrane protein